MTAPQSAWTDERIETMRKLWNDGLSASQIAAKLNCGLTRNAVIGKVHRMGLKRSPAAQRAAYEIGRPKAPKREATARIPVVVALPNYPVWAPLPGSTPVGMMDLRGTSCRWPVELAGATEAMFCGCHTVRTYCTEHENAERLRSRKQHPNSKLSEEAIKRFAERLAA